mmetsp:Transcript_28244/g.79008  ORF Transcript_28244/g.79008 Transcript_28244/m.79008 type:complete len:215 (-) Transcript_28244:191-835(-)
MEVLLSPRLGQHAAGLARDSLLPGSHAHEVRVVRSAHAILEPIPHHTPEQLVHGRIGWGTYQQPWTLVLPLQVVPLLLPAARHDIRDLLAQLTVVVPLEVDHMQHVQHAADGVRFARARRTLNQGENPWCTCPACRRGTPAGAAGGLRAPTERSPLLHPGGVAGRAKHRPQLRWIEARMEMEVECVRRTFMWDWRVAVDRRGQVLRLQQVRQQW